MTGFGAACAFGVAFGVVADRTTTRRCLGEHLHVRRFVAFQTAVSIKDISRGVS